MTDPGDVIAGAVIGFMVGMVFLVMAWGDINNSWRREAVERGHAVYTVDSRGNVHWDWKPTK